MTKITVQYWEKVSTMSTEELQNALYWLSFHKDIAKVAMERGTGYVVWD